MMNGETIRLDGALRMAAEVGGGASAAPAPASQPAAPRTRSGGGAGACLVYKTQRGYESERPHPIGKGDPEMGNNTVWTIVGILLIIVLVLFLI